MGSPLRRLDPVARRSWPPHCYLWQSLWWRAESNRGYPSTPASRRYSRNLLRLFRDMLGNPEHYRRKPAGTTDWQWSGLKSVT
jgi:hypothetical protein